MPRERVLFVTLTYPFPVSSTEFKRHLHRFSKSFLRRFPRAWYIWRAERTRRGRWHVHMIIYRVPFWHWFNLAKVWARSIGAENKRWLRTMTDIEVAHSTRALMFYAAKYLGKESRRRDDVDEFGEIDEPGRLWGIVGRANVEHETVSLYLPRNRFMALRRVLRRLYRVDVSLLTARNVWFDAVDPILRWLRFATGNDQLCLQVHASGE